MSVASEIPALPGDNQPESVKQPIVPFLRDVLGPGLITGASDDDPSGIATYSQVGAKFGFEFGWILLFSWPLMCAVQEISARIGRVTGKGLAGAIAKEFPKPALYGIVALLLVANTLNIGADLGAMGAALKLLIGGPQILYVALFAVVSVLLETFMRYARYVAVLKWLTLVLFAYVAVAFSVHVPWGTVARDLVLPHVTMSSDYLTAIVAVLGTTISPYLFFWQANSEVEEAKEAPQAEPLKHAPRQAPAAFTRIRIDTYLGMALSNAVALFIVISAAATLHAQGHTDIQTSSEAAEALRPIAGPLVFLIFATGIIGTGLLALPVLAGSAAYAVGEAFGWRVGLAQTAGRAKEFYGVIAIATAIGAGMNFIALDPIKALFWSAVINGLVAAPVMAMLMLLASRKSVMGQFTLPPLLKAVGWLATIVMAVAAVFMIGAMFF